MVVYSNVQKTIKRMEEINNYQTLVANIKKEAGL